jgi:hypothetical protein
MSNLKRIGSISYRTDELSFKEFHLLNRADKDEYLFLLKGLPENERSTNDLTIINLYLKEKNNFFSIKE